MFDCPMAMSMNLVWFSFSTMSMFLWIHVLPARLQLQWNVVKWKPLMIWYRVVLLTGPPKNFLSTKSLYNCWHLGEIPGQFAWDPVLRKFRGGPVKWTTLYEILSCCLYLLLDYLLNIVMVASTVCFLVTLIWWHMCEFNKFICDRYHHACRVISIRSNQFPVVPESVKLLKKYQFTHLIY